MGYFTEDFDMISIHISYRMGLFGFATDLDSIPENIGFYDQKMALEWIFENIEALGGARDMVTFIGQGFGGVTALLHAQNFRKKSKRLFKSTYLHFVKFPSNDFLIL